MSEHHGDPPLEHPGSECCPVCRAEAARLRAELERTEEARVAYEKERDWLDGKLTEARAERDRYREALREIAEVKGSGEWYRATARAALEGSDK